MDECFNGLCHLVIAGAGVYRIMVIVDHFSNMSSSFQQRYHVEPRILLIYSSNIL